MSGFSFSFELESADGVHDRRISGSEITDVVEEIGDEIVQKLCFEVPCPNSSATEEGSTEFSVHNVGDYVFKKALIPVNSTNSGTSSTSSPYYDFDEENDLIPGQYEGGFKIWECSYDLAEIIVESRGILPHPPKRVLELGCGHGVPGIVTMMIYENLSEIVFSDFNSEVLEITTWPNVVLNSPTEMHKNVRCIAGDWSSLSSLIGRFDLILSAETLYTVESCRKVFDIVESHLEPDGVALIASKKYYFGVGGGTFELENLAARPTSSLHYSLVKAYENGQSNIREVIKLVRK